jgi:hypothetical protein
MELGFIILRHVNSLKTDVYWQKCYDCIRIFYPLSPIMIIDDNSDYHFVSNKELRDTTIVQSEFPGRGEILPYYYYLKNKFAYCAVVLHDSVFIQKPIDFTVQKYKMIWEFTSHEWDQKEDELRMINSLTDNKELIEFHANKDLWTGCLGVMSVITYDFLKYIDDKHTISNLLYCITSRYNRMSLERVFACILQYNSPKYTLFGDIIYYSNTEYKEKGYKHECTIEDYVMQLKKYSSIRDVPLIKIWSGR